MGHSAFMKSLPGERIRRNPGRRSMNWNCDYYIPQARIDDGDSRVYEEDIHEYDAERQREYMAPAPSAYGDGRHDRELYPGLGPVESESESGAGGATASIMDLARPVKVKAARGRGKGKHRQRYANIQDALQSKRPAAVRAANSNLKVNSLDAAALAAYSDDININNAAVVSLSFKFLGGDIDADVDGSEAFSEIWGASDIGSVSEIWEDDWDSGSESDSPRRGVISGNDEDGWEEIYESESEGESGFNRRADNKESERPRGAPRISYAAALRQDA